MKIEKTKPEDLDIVMDLYDWAREFMNRTGNGNQWIAGYPSREQISKDIEDGNSYVCIHPEHGIVCVFFFRRGNDPTYAKIYEGEWLNDEPYGVVHRIAGNGKVKGVASYCMEWCYEQYGNIRVDTHEDNKVMQSVLEKNGYTRCGIIYVANGTPRVAFQKI